MATIESGARRPSKRTLFIPKNGKHPRLTIMLSHDHMRKLLNAANNSGKSAAFVARTLLQMAIDFDERRSRIKKPTAAEVSRFQDRAREVGLS